MLDLIFLIYKVHLYRLTVISSYEYTACQVTSFTDDCMSRLNLNNNIAQFLNISLLIITCININFQCKNIAPYKYNYMTELFIEYN